MKKPDIIEKPDIIKKANSARRGKLSQARKGGAQTLESVHVEYLPRVVCP